MRRTRMVLGALVICAATAAGVVRASVLQAATDELVTFIQAWQRWRGHVVNDPVVDLDEDQRATYRDAKAAVARFLWRLNPPMASMLPVLVSAVDNSDRPACAAGTDMGYDSDFVSWSAWYIRPYRVSAGGRYAVFVAQRGVLSQPADDSVEYVVYRRDLETMRTEIVSAPSGAFTPKRGKGPTMSWDGRYVAFHSNEPLVPGVPPAQYSRVYVRDMATGRTELVSVSYTGGAPGDSCFQASISPDGRYVVYTSRANNIVQTSLRIIIRCPGYHCYLFDRKTGRTVQVDVWTDGQPATWSWCPAISWGGRYVVFAAYAPNWPGQQQLTSCAHTQIFLRDMEVGRTYLISGAYGGSTASNDFCLMPAISPDGSRVAFVSAADNLVPGDNNGRWDVFIRLRDSGEIIRVTERYDEFITQDVEWNGLQFAGRDGRYLVYQARFGDGSWASYLFDIDARSEVTGWSGNNWPMAIGPFGRFVLTRRYSSSLGYNCVYLNDRYPWLD